MLSWQIRIYRDVGDGIAGQTSGDVVPNRRSSGERVVSHLYHAVARTG